MKTKNIAKLITIVALNTLFACHAQNIFLHNSYGGSIYLQTSPTAAPKEIRNNVRIPVGTIANADNIDISIAGGSSMSVSYFSLKPTMTKIGFSASQHPNQDAVIYVNPSSFYQAWNIGVDWEKGSSTISSFKSKEILNQGAKEKLLKLLLFTKKPVYKQGQGKNQQNVNPINRTNDQATNMAIEMARTEPYTQETLSEIYDIVNTQIPFQLSYNDEATLKQQILTFIRSEMNRLKQK